METTTSTKTYEGRVIFFERSKGFGRIYHPELGQVFLHQSKLAENYKIAHANDLVSYDVMPSTRKAGVFEAINVQFIKNENLELITHAFEEQTILKGKAARMNAGGLLMDIYGIEVFLPKSEVDLFEYNSYKVFLDKELEVRIIAMDGRNIVASRKVVLEEEEHNFKPKNSDPVY